MEKIRKLSSSSVQNVSSPKANYESKQFMSPRIRRRTKDHSIKEPVDATAIMGSKVAIS